MCKVLLSAAAGGPLCSYLKENGCTISFISGSRIADAAGTAFVSRAIADHPDIYYCKLGCRDDSPVFRGDPHDLKAVYPGDIIYNAACTGRYIIHNFRYTAVDLVNAARNMDMRAVDVSQGYAKCNTVIIDEDSVITSDHGMAGAMIKAGLDVLLIENGHISLPGFEYGFIGGTSGRIHDEIVFNGDLSLHPDFKNICAFIGARGLTVKYFNDYPLTDIGSIITVG